MPRPAAPRAVRPARRTYSEGSRGKSNSTTCPTPGTSSPRLARSVATSTAGGSPYCGARIKSCGEGIWVDYFHAHVASVATADVAPAVLVLPCRALHMYPCRIKHAHGM